MTTESSGPPATSVDESATGNPAPSDDPTLEHRVLLHAPAGRDAAVVKQVLAAQSIQADICGTMDELVHQIERGAVPRSSPRKR